MGQALWSFLYNGVQALASPLSPFLFSYFLLKKKYRKQLPLRLGKIDKIDNLKRPVIWIHALSLGEVNAAFPFIKEVRKNWKDATLLLTATTQTGLDALIKKSKVLSGPYHITAMPFDILFVVRRFLDIYSPDCFVLVETDVWPNVIWELKRRAIPSFLASGSISSVSVSRSKFLRSFFKEVYDSFSIISMQSEDDRKRLSSLGIDRKKLVCLGNFKFDIPLRDISEDKKKEIRERYHLSDSKIVFVAGSTHRGEEEIILETFLRLKSYLRGIKLIIAPRDINRTHEIISLIKALGLSYILRSQLNKASDSSAEVLLIDTFGELMDCYLASDLSFVGGSLVPVGGHNLFEPASCGVGVLFGPYVESCKDMARLLIERGGGIMVSKEDIFKHALEIINNPKKLSCMGRNSREAVVSVRGAIKRHIDVLNSLLKEYN